MSCFEHTELTVHTYRDTIHPSMPFAVDDNTLAFHLGIRNKTLWYLIKDKNKFYKCFKIKQFHKNGEFKKFRPIQAPEKQMKAVHVVLNGIFSKIMLPDNVAAYVPKKNCPSTARNHVKKGVIIQMDIENFFNTARRSWIRKYLFEDVGYSHYVSCILADLCTYQNFLPQGSPLSGYLANLVAWHRFGNLVKVYLENLDPRWRFDIYSDDMIISHPDEIDDETVRRVIDNIHTTVKAAGYKINKKKTRVRRPKEQQRVLGCVVNEKLNIPKYSYNKIRCLIHNCKHTGFDTQAERCGKGNGKAVIQYIRGMLEYFKQIREDRFNKLNTEFQIALALHGELK